MTAKPIVLWVPDLWRELIRGLMATPWFTNNVQSMDLPVAHTGKNDDLLKRIHATRERLNIMLLPITHCALNMEDVPLRLLGPAVSTRNDIYVFRRTDPQSYAYGDKHHKFKVAVKETEITTSIAFYVALARWSACAIHVPDDDLPMNARGTLIDAAKTVRHQLLNDLFEFVDVDDPLKRMEGLIDGGTEPVFDAAIFMGKELRPKRNKRTVNLFDQPEVLDIVNLNREINNLYNVHSFPRAAFAMFAEDEAEAAHAQLITDFEVEYNAAVAALPLPPMGRRMQRLRPTGANSDPADIRTFIKFTEDMETDPVKKLRKEGKSRKIVKQVDRSRALTLSDFPRWPLIYRETLRDVLKSKVVSALNPKAKDDPTYEALIPELAQRLATVKELPSNSGQLTDWLARQARQSGHGDKVEYIGKTFDQAFWAVAANAVEANVLRRRGG